MFSKVLILSASAGAGHIRAAQALEKAFAQSGAAREVLHVDVLTYATAVFRKLYSDGYLKLVNKAPRVMGWVYDHWDRPWDRRLLSTAINKFNTRRLVRMLEEFQPDLTVCTHFLPAEIVSRLKKQGELQCPLAITVTDLDAHAIWLCQNFEHYFVAIDETRVYLESLGVPHAKVSVTGIPIDPVFATPKDKTKMRLKHGLDSALPTILISLGGLGVGPVDRLLASLCKLKHPAQVVCICGRNEELFQTAQNWLDTQPADCPTRFKILGFTTEMDELMAAADLLVGKPGGLTASEALARGLVMVIVNPIPGQEERNADHLLEEGAALRCNNLPVLAYKIDALLDDPARLERLRENAIRIGRPNSARDIVNRLVQS